MAAGERNGVGFAEGQVVTVFRSRRRDQAESDYQRVVRAMETAARADGFVDFKTFTADDGEHVSLVTFASPAAQRAWRDHPATGAPSSRAATSSTSNTRSRSDSAPTSPRGCGSPARPEPRPASGRPVGDAPDRPSARSVGIARNRRPGVAADRREEPVRRVPSPSPGGGPDRTRATTAATTAMVSTRFSSTPVTGSA